MRFSSFQKGIVSAETIRGNKVLQNIHQQDTWDINDSPYGTVYETLYIFFSIVLFPTFDLRKQGDIGGCKVSLYQICAKKFILSHPTLFSVCH